MIVTVSSTPILTHTFGSSTPAASAVPVSRKPGRYPPTSNAPPVALTFKKVRLVKIFVICRSLTRRPRDGWRGGYADMFRIGRCFPTWQYQCPRRLVSVFSRAVPPPTSIVPIGSSRTEAPAPRPTPLAADGSMQETDLRSSSLFVFRRSIPAYHRSGRPHRRDGPYRHHIAVDHSRTSFRLSQLRRESPKATACPDFRPRHAAFYSGSGEP